MSSTLEASSMAIANISIKSFGDAPIDFENKKQTVRPYSTTFYRT